MSGRARDNGHRRPRWVTRFDPPADFGMDRHMLAAERARLRRLGWQEWEIDARLQRPQDVPRAPPGEPT